MSEDTCSICLQNGNLQSLTRCSHSFHSRCIRRWYERMRRYGVTCPLCREMIDSNDIHYPERRRCNVHYKTIMGDTMLMFACKKNDVVMVDYLLDRGVDVNDVNVNGNGALIVASFFGFLGVVQKLVEKGVDVRHENKSGNTALMWAARRGNMDVVRYLVEKGADVSEKLFKFVKFRGEVMDYLKNFYVYNNNG